MKSRANVRSTPLARPRPSSGGAVASRPFSKARVPRGTTHVEVERKFLFDPSLVARLLLSGPRRAGPLGPVRDLGGRTFTDEYFDDAGAAYPLTTRDVWLRARDGALQMKIHDDAGAGPGTDTFLEVVGAGAVADRLERYSAEGVLRARRRGGGREEEEEEEEEEQEDGDVRALLRARYNLTPFCRITTSRRSFVLQDRFRLDLDSADFGHRVGELELAVPLPPGCGGGCGASPERRREIARAAEREIADFCGRHAWFFEAAAAPAAAGAGGAPAELGKLTAYIRRFNPEQWKALTESPALKKKLFRGK